MKIKNQKFDLIDPEFEFDIDAEFEIEISLEQACFSNCVLVVFGWVDADEFLYPYCSEYKIRSQTKKEKVVLLDKKLEAAISSEIDGIFQKKFDSYVDESNEIFLQDYYECKHHD